MFIWRDISILLIFIIYKSRHFDDYKSPLGYVADGKKIDTYGVDHSGFTTKDEIEYQMARQKRESSLIEGYNNQGITKDYPLIRY